MLLELQQASVGGIMDEVFADGGIYPESRHITGTVSMRRVGKYILVPALLYGLYAGVEGVV